MKKLRKISLVLIPLVLIFAVKLYFSHPSFSDENIYYAMGKIVAAGQKPYLNFNFVHPPIQLYLLAGIFTLLGPSLMAAKILPLTASSLSVLLLYMSSKKLFDENSAVFSSLLFILTPAFLAFSDQGYGMWEAILFIMVSFYLALKEKHFASGFFFATAVFTRYLSALFFPLIVIVLVLKKSKWKSFFSSSVIFGSIFFAAFYLLFGFNFIDQTILFQVFAKVNLGILPKLPFQYLELGFFSMFLALISVIVGIYKKNKFVILFSLYPMVIDIIIFFGFMTIIYHYFLVSLVFLFLGLGKAFESANEKLIRAGIVLIILISIYQNYPTIDYYQNPAYSQHFIDVANFVQSHLSKGDKVFGESSVTTYIMFTRNIPISSNYLDSFLSYLIYRSEAAVIANIEKEKPKAIIDMDGYYENNPIFEKYLSEKYTKTAEFQGIPTYIVYLRNS